MDVVCMKIPINEDRYARPMRLNVGLVIFFLQPKPKQSDACLWVSWRLITVIKI